MAILFILSGFTRYLRGKSPKKYFHIFVFEPNSLISQHTKYWSTATRLIKIQKCPSNLFYLAKTVFSIFSHKIKNPNFFFRKRRD